MRSPIRCPFGDVLDESPSLFLDAGSVVSFVEADDFDEGAGERDGVPEEVGHGREHVAEGSVVLVV